MRESEQGVCEGGARPAHVTTDPRAPLTVIPRVSSSGHKQGRSEREPEACPGLIAQSAPEF